MKCCLIVDDSRMVRTVARKILEKLDFEIEEATDGKEALDACKRRMPDAVLLDWDMPVMDGLEFLRELRTNVEGGMDPVVVFCTTQTGVERIREAMRAGANEYIMKPFDSDILESKFAQTGLL